MICFVKNHLHGNLLEKTIEELERLLFETVHFLECFIECNS